MEGGYGSKPLEDDVNYTFTLCEECLADLFTSFKIPVAVHDRLSGIDDPPSVWCNLCKASHVVLRCKKKIPTAAEMFTAKHDAAVEAEYYRKEFGGADCPACGMTLNEAGRAHADGSKCALPDY